MKIPHLWLKNIIGFCVALTLLTPLLSTNRDFFSAVSEKAFAFQILVAVMGAAWILLALAEPKYRPRFKHPLVIAMTLFFVVLVANLFVSIDPAHSLWSTRGRMMGVWNLFFYWLWFLVLSSTYKDWREWKKLFSLSVVVSVAIAILGIYSFILDPSMRIEVTLGNPTYLGSYALLHVFISLLLFVEVASKEWKAVIILTAILNTAAIFISGTRASLLALVITGILLGIYVIYKKTKKRSSVFAGAISILLLCGFIVASVWFVSSSTNRTKENKPLDRLVHISFNEGRIDLWKLAWVGFLERPVFGWGVENFEAPFNLNFDPAGKNKVLAAGDVWDDRAHNQFLEMLVTVGIIGFVSYLLIWLSTFFTLLRSMHKEKFKNHHALILILGSLIFAHLIQLSFSFDMPASHMILTAVLAFIVAFSHKIPTIEKKEKTETKGIQPNIFTIGILATIVLSSQYFTAVLPYIKAVQNTAAASVIYSNREQALAMYKSSLNVRTIIDTDLRFTLIDGILPVTQYFSDYGPAFKKLVVFASRQLEDSAERRPYDYRTQLSAAIAHRLAGPVEAGRLEKGKMRAMRAIQLGPLRSEAYEQLAEIAFIENDPWQAIAYLEDALERARPVFGVGRIEFRLATAYALVGDTDEVFRHLDLASEQKFPIYDDPLLLRSFADIVDEIEKDDRIVEYTRATVNSHPTHPDILHNSSIVFFTFDLKEEALATYRQLNRISPSDSQKLRKELGI